MMTMSKPLSAGQAQRYHAEQFRDAGENYYSEGTEIRGRWDGRLAAEWGLADEVSESRSSALRLALRAGLTALGISRK